MTCDDYNLAESIKAPESKRFKETMLLNKIDQSSMYVPKTSNGKFRYRRRQASYCPDKQQRQHAGIEPEPWLPRDGLYTSPDADFEDRCLKFGDAIIDLASKSITSGADRCEIYSHDDPLADDTVIWVVCNEMRNTKSLITKMIGSRSMLGPPGFEIIRLEKVDDKTLLLEKTHNGQFSEPGRKLAYCSDEASADTSSKRPQSKSHQLATVHRHPPSAYLIGRLNAAVLLGAS